MEVEGVSTLTVYAWESLFEEDIKEFCSRSVQDCFQCEEARDCPVLKELFLRAGRRESNRRGEPKMGSVHPLNKLNDLSGAEWLYFTKTLLTTAFPSRYAHHLRKAHGANKPPELMKMLIEFFTKGGEKVLDPFAGVGGTLIGASISNPPRYCEGIEINPRWIDVYHQVLRECPELREYPLHLGDCRKIMAQYPDGAFHFITTDPPYNLHLERTMCNGKYAEHSNRKTDYNMESDDPDDLANLASYEEYLDAIGQVLSECYRVLLPGRYMTIIIRNAFQNGEYIFTHADIAARAKQRGFVPKGEIIWYQAGTRLRPYGYPFSYVPNIVHQYILVLHKPESSR